MSIVGIVLLVAAAVLVVAVEWPRLAPRAHLEGVRAPNMRRRRHKARLHVVSDDDDDDPDDFARSVERDLAALPTIDERDRKR
ncbi:MAG TPA: hypothetical protein VIJ70_09205 [Gaiellaceae bacterium]